MSIDNAGLKALYRARAESPATPSRRGCPSPKKLLGVLRSGLSSRQETRGIDHLSRCDACSGEFAFLTEALRSETALLRDLEQWRSRQSPEANPGRAGEAGGGRRTEGKALLSRLSWPAVPVGVGLLLVLFFVSTRLIFRPHEAYRAEEGGRIELLRPAGGVARDSLVFRWKRSPGYDRYVLRLFDQALAIVWQSGGLAADSLRLPPEAAVKLDSGRPYFWMVTAGRADGREIKSTLTEFSVKD